MRNRTQFQWANGGMKFSQGGHKNNTKNNDWQLIKRAPIKLIRPLAKSTPRSTNNRPKARKNPRVTRYDIWDAIAEFLKS